MFSVKMTRQSEIRYLLHNTAEELHSFLFCQTPSQSRVDPCSHPLYLGPSAGLWKSLGFSPSHFRVKGLVPSKLGQLGQISSTPPISRTLANNLLMKLNSQSNLSSSSAQPSLGFRSSTDARD